MKTMSLLFAAIFFLSSTNVFAQGKSKTETVQIKTSAICGECKERIEVALYALKGVKSAKLDLATKAVTVKYKPASVSAEQLHKAINAAGYDADEMPADQQAYQKLPHCCQKGGHD